MLMELTHMDNDLLWTGAVIPNHDGLLMGVVANHENSDDHEVGLYLAYLPYVSVIKLQAKLLWFVVDKFDF